MAPDENGRETDDDCRMLFTNCRPSRAADIVIEYARNNTRWHQDFGPAFQILVEHGYPDGHLVAAGQDLPILIDPMVNTPSPVVSDGTTGTVGATDSARSITAAFVMVALGTILSTLFQ